jgi:lipopolysaccharide biosynthesis protein
MEKLQGNGRSAGMLREASMQSNPSKGRLATEDHSWLEPPDRPAFLSLRDARPRGRIAIVVHVYYAELWPELSDAIANIMEPFDLFVTLVAGRSDGLAQTISQERQFAHILTVENHGRDILPFFSIVRTGVLFRYEVICKLHTKRSEWHEDGEAWRKQLVTGILGNSRLVRLILGAFRSDRKLGMIVADGHIYRGRELWEGNRKYLHQLFTHFDMDESEFGKSFAGGSIFWIRPAILRLISELPFRFDDFDPEPLGKDGHLVHAIERLISLACYEAGMTIKETNAILAEETEGVGAP